MEGLLRRVTERCWEVWMHRYQVHIAEQGGQRYVWLTHGGQGTERCLWVSSLADGAKLAREWIEKPGCSDR